MKACPDHWNKLRSAIQSRGLFQFVAKDGRIAMQNTVLQLEGREAEAKWDPLMAAYWMIMGRAMELGGLYLMTADENGNEYCPVCEAVKHGGTEAIWIDGPADAVLEDARERGLVPPEEVQP